jgi:acetylornithine deacetylase/succinyl-diaminopimelate desuccinylase-like protein
LSVERILFAEAAATAAGEEIVKDALASSTNVLGVDAEPAGFTACCDLWFLKNRAGIPTVIIGPGNLSMAHKRDEFIELDELERGAALYEDLVVRRLSSG